MASSCETCGRPLGILGRLKGQQECDRCRDDEMSRIRQLLGYSQGELRNWHPAGLPDKLSDADLRGFIDMRRRAWQAMRAASQSEMNAAAKRLMPSPIPCGAYLEGRQGIDCQTRTFLSSSVDGAAIVLPSLLGEDGNEALVVWWRVYCAGIGNFGGPTPIDQFSDPGTPADRLVYILDLLKTIAYADHFRPQDIQGTPWTEPGYVAYADCLGCQFSRMDSGV